MATTIAARRRRLPEAVELDRRRGAPDAVDGVPVLAGPARRAAWAADGWSVATFRPGVPVRGRRFRSRRAPGGRRTGQRPPGGPAAVAERPPVGPAAAAGQRFGTAGCGARGAAAASGAIGEARFHRRVPVERARRPIVPVDGAAGSGPRPGSGGRSAGTSPICVASATIRSGDAACACCVRAPAGSRARRSRPRVCSLASRDLTLGEHHVERHDGEHGDRGDARFRRPRPGGCAGPGGGAPPGVSTTRSWGRRVPGSAPRARYAAGPGAAARGRALVDAADRRARGACRPQRARGSRVATARGPEGGAACAAPSSWRPDSRSATCRDPLGGAEPCALRTGVRGDLFGRRAAGAARAGHAGGPAAAPARPGGRAARARPARTRAAKRLLHQAVLERVVREHEDAALGLQQVHRLVESRPRGAGARGSPPSGSPGRCGGPGGRRGAGPGAGIASFTASTSSPVVSSGRRATIRCAIWRANRSSPFSAMRAARRSSS